MQDKKEFHIAVVDDHESYGRYICEIVEEMTDRYSTDFFCDVENVLKSDKYYDLMILDVEIGKDNGIEMSGKLTDKTDYIVYLTSHTECVMDAFGYKTVGFLTKDMPEEVLKERLKKICSEYLEKSVRFTTDYGALSVRMSSVLYITVQNRRMYCHLRNGREFIIRDLTVSQLTDILDNRMFVQTDRSTVVNLDCITSIDGLEITLCDGTVLYISRRLKNAVHREWLKRFR